MLKPANNQAIPYGSIPVSILQMPMNLECDLPKSIIHYIFKSTNVFDISFFFKQQSKNYKISSKTKTS